MVCPRCGESCAENNSFCHACGCSLVNALPIRTAPEKNGANEPSKALAIGIVFGIIVLGFGGIAWLVGDTPNDYKPVKQTADNNKSGPLVTPPTPQTPKSNPEFETFYRDFKKWHDMQTTSIERMQMLLSRAARGELAPESLYTNLKEMEEPLLMGWNYWDKKRAPAGLNEKQAKELKQQIEFMALSFLFIKDAASALRDGMNNPGSVDAKSRFNENIKKAIMTNQASGQSVEKIKAELIP